MQNVLRDQFKFLHIYLHEARGPRPKRKNKNEIGALSVQSVRCYLTWGISFHSYVPCTGKWSRLIYTYNLMSATTAARHRPAHGNVCSCFNLPFQRKRVAIHRNPRSFMSTIDFHRTSVCVWWIWFSVLSVWCCNLHALSFTFNRFHNWFNVVHLCVPFRYLHFIAYPRTHRHDMTWHGQNPVSMWESFKAIVYSSSLNHIVKPFFVSSASSRAYHLYFKWDWSAQCK